eukprot:TRINITY_DN1228_c0_g1_i2.p2 TRINITY_DN1228_c0_g1~~TRINITY_DN1228_c0_g1_i2.p2  ORF type:complete len:160 (-),score=39.77 TRINITY_DN1228_c0_g1_i2:46-525(-)
MFPPQFVRVEVDPGLHTGQQYVSVWSQTCVPNWADSCPFFFFFFFLVVLLLSRATRDMGYNIFVEQVLALLHKGQAPEHQTKSTRDIKFFFRVDGIDVPLEGKKPHEVVKDLGVNPDFKIYVRGLTTEEIEERKKLTPDQIQRAEFLKRKLAEKQQGAK